MSQQEAPSSLSMERGNSPTGADGEVMQVDEDEDTSFAVTDSVPLLGPRGPNGEWELGSGSDMEDDDSDHCHLDCYPYTFTPLLLFAPSSYFDKGYSNYNSVASFFGTQLPCNMLDNVLYERKNMIYEELLDHVVQHQMLVVCCIDAHFTAFQVICHPKKPKKKHLLYYDPLKASLQLVSNEDFKKFALFQLMKCHYGDSQHIQEHKDHYTSPLEGNPTRRLIYSLWKKINSLDSVSDLYIQTKTAPLNLNRWLLINSKTNPRQMSTQLTGNTCYFQTFL